MSTPSSPSAPLPYYNTEVGPVYGLFTHLSVSASMKEASQHVNLRPKGSL